MDTQREGKELELLEQTIVHNLLYLLKTKRLSISDFARQINVPRGTINNIINKKVLAPTIPLIHKMANFFEITIDQLVKHKLSDQSYFYIASNGIPDGYISKIPVLNWDDAHQTIQNIMTTDKRLEFKDWLDLGKLISENSVLFAMRSKSSYEPKFPSNAFLIFARNVAPADNHYVLVNDQNKGKISLMQYFYDGNNEYISPLHEGKKSLFEPEHTAFLGVLSFVKLELN